MRNLFQKIFSFVFVGALVFTININNLFPPLVHLIPPSQTSIPPTKEIDASPTNTSTPTRTSTPTHTPTTTPSLTSTPVTGLMFTDWSVGCTATPYVTCSATIKSTHTDPYRWDFDITFNYGDTSNFFGSDFGVTLVFHTGVYNQNVPIWWNMYPITNEVMPNRSIDVIYPVSDLSSMSYPSGNWTVEAQPWNYDRFDVHFNRTTGGPEIFVRTDKWHFTIATYPNVATPTITPTATMTSLPTSTPTSVFTPTIAYTLTPPLGYTYDRSAAVSYADQWAHDRNSNYPNYGDGCNCDDCTNYLSQVLQNGNYPLRPGNYDKNSHFEWWYRDLIIGFDNSKTWSATDWFNSYAAQYPAEFEVNIPLNSLLGGDFILLDLHDNDNVDLPPDGKPDHARIVVGNGYTSTDPIDYTDSCGGSYTIPNSVNTLLINQHCPDRKHVAWDFNIDSSTSRWYIQVK